MSVQFIPTPETVQIQYAASPRINSLVDGFAKRLLPNDDIQLFYDTIFNIETAQGYGLDVWGIILGISRIIDIPYDEYLGFDGSEYDPFDQGTFYVERVNDTFELVDHAYRDILLFKALSNISAADAASVNKLLTVYFNGKEVYVQEIGIMKVKIIFRFLLDPWIKYMFLSKKVLPLGAGVDVEITEITPDTFGFKGTEFLPFNQGTFYHS